MFRALLDLCSCRKEGFQENPEAAARRLQAKRKFTGSPVEMKQSRLPRKFPKLKYVKSVPQTDTGGQLE